MSTTFPIFSGHFFWLTDGLQQGAEYSLIGESFINPTRPQTITDSRPSTATCGRRLPSTGTPEATMEPNVRKARTCITPPMLAILQR
mgnify:FL=1|tara:strand:+ start:344 stop:604 length:261 start_codon:yes stop_codon:yes gene_type:complete